jgi:hypothetical protein
MGQVAMRRTRLFHVKRYMPDQRGAPDAVEYRQKSSSWAPPTVSPSACAVNTTARPPAFTSCLATPSHSSGLKVARETATSYRAAPSSSARPRHTRKDAGGVG